MVRRAALLNLYSVPVSHLFILPCPLSARHGGPMRGVPSCWMRFSVYRVIHRVPSTDVC